MNKSAKAADNPRHRRRFYAEKCWAVSRAIVLGVARAVSYDVNTGLLSVSFKHCGQIHVPVDGLSRDARRSVRPWIIRQFEALAS